MHRRRTRLQAYPGAERLLVAITRRIDRPSAPEQALDSIALDRRGYDVNILGTAPELTTVE